MHMILRCFSRNTISINFYANTQLETSPRTNRCKQICAILVFAKYNIRLRFSRNIIHIHISIHTHIFIAWWNGAYLIWKDVSGLNCVRYCVWLLHFRVSPQAHSWVFFCSCTNCIFCTSQPIVGIYHFAYISHECNYMTFGYLEK